MGCRGVRGATSVEKNEAAAILAATRVLLEEITTANQMAVEDIGGVIFTATPDLNAAYPAQAARDLGWVQTPLICTQEMAVEGSLPRCIRVLVLWNTGRTAAEIQHVYLGRARKLRPDLIEQS